MPTIADEWIEEGRQQGLEQARQVWRQEAVILVLKARFGFVPANLVESLNRIYDVPILVQLLEAAATTKSLAEFAETPLPLKAFATSAAKRMPERIR